MRAVVQRVSAASVEVDGETIGAIERGLAVLIGVAGGDGPGDVAYIVRKVAGLRCFNDASGKFNHSVDEVGGSILAVSQFTLFGDCRKGRRPSFEAAAPPAQAEALYEDAVAGWRAMGLPVETGRFGAHMRVRIENEGPVTLLLDSAKAG